MQSIIALDHITKQYRDGGITVALSDISFEIRPGEFFVLLGPSGCGKSTLLRIMSGLDTDFGGHITLESGITSHDFSFVFQQFALLPWLTVAENIGLGLYARHVPLHARKARIAEELTLFGLEKFGNHHPHELSGGMKQRVGIARAFATDPKVIFMDEPFSELDSFTAEKLREELLTIWEKRKVTVVMVTHIIPEAIELADRIAVLTSRPGKIEKIISNTIARPRTMRSTEVFALEDELHKLIMKDTIHS